MKYGMLWFKKTTNIGDDIQSYAQERFLPRVDYFVEREEISAFKSHNNEPVAVIMNSWWLWRKWNWPPAKCIIPKLISMHFTQWTTENWGSPIKNEIFEGIGKEYMNSYGPVGCRDYDTLELLKSYGIKGYFSGCLTLTLPKMKIKKQKKEYICAVDVDERVLNKLKEIVNDKLDIKIMTHDLPVSNEELSWNRRRKNVEKTLTCYQNAKCVITSRLHVSLPCLAIETPVLLVRESHDWDRFIPYLDLINNMSIQDFCDNMYDVFNPLENKKDYLKIRNNLIKEINEFIHSTSNMSGTLDEIRKTKYTDEEVKDWQYDLMKEALEKWFFKSREMLREYNKTIDYLRKVEKQVSDYENSTCWKITKPLRIFKDKMDSLKNRRSK